MFETDKLLYLELHRTGSTRIASVLQQVVGGQTTTKHRPLSVPTRGKLIMGSVRNPWDWYVSVFAYACMGERSSLYRAASRREIQWPSRHLRSWALRTWPQFRKKPGLWRPLLRDPGDPEAFRAWLKLVFDHRRTCDLGMDYWRYNILRDVGLMTLRYCKLYLKNFTPRIANKAVRDYEALCDYANRNTLAHAFVRTESLSADLVVVLRKAGYELSEAQLNAIRHQLKDRKNASERLSVNEYYDDKTLDLVARRDCFIIERHRYEPTSGNGGSSGRPLR